MFISKKKHNQLIKEKNKTIEKAVHESFKAGFQMGYDKGCDYGKNGIKIKYQA